MIRIKTILRPMETAEQVAAFDAEVNAALAKGWALRKREVLKLPTAPSDAYNVAAFAALYAELTREEPEDIFKE